MYAGSQSLVAGRPAVRVVRSAARELAVQTQIAAATASAVPPGLSVAVITAVSVVTRTSAPPINLAARLSGSVETTTAALQGISARTQPTAAATPTFAAAHRAVIGASSATKDALVARLAISYSAPRGPARFAFPGVAMAPVVGQVGRAVSSNIFLVNFEKWK